MSWQLGAFAILGLTLVAGFAWYERSRPDARIVALVATLAAFAALGRIAFAAVPNVKPTTDIVLIAGYALGGGPGFAVGALAALSSNFFFGQGPWTPWQMAGWGLTGIIGAVLAVLTARRIRRIPLAALCGIAGFAFTILQDLGDWVTYSDHSLAQLGAYVGTGLSFDAVHAVGCVAFALAIGPAMIHSIGRFSKRLSVRWLPPGSVLPLVLVTLGVAVLGSGGAPAARATAAPGAPVNYLLGAQNVDGGFGAAPGQPSSGLFSGWAALGLAAAGENPRQVSHGGRSAAAYVLGAAAGRLDTGSLERTILVLRAAGLPPAAGGHSLAAELESRVGRGGSVAGQVNLTAFAMLALRSAGVSPPDRMGGWLRRQQDRDGGFGFATAGASSDIDDTGAVLEALAGAPGSAPVRARAAGYLRGRQNLDGGFPSQPGMSSNAQSTAWAVQGLEAAGVDPATLHRHGARSPLSYLRSLITASGSVMYARGQSETPVWVTGETLMALDGRPLPLAPVPVRGHHRHGAAQHAAPPRRPRRRTPSLRAIRHPRRERHLVLRPAFGASVQHRLRSLAADAGLATAVMMAPLGLD